MITFSIPCNPSKSKASSHYVLNFSKADWNGISSYLLEYDFSPLYVLIEPDAIWSFLKQIITSSSHLFIPKIKINTSKGPKWFSSDIRHDLNCIHILRRMFKKLPTSSNHLKLTQAESYLQDKMLLAKSNYEFELVRAFTNKESCKIYNYIRSLSRHNMLSPTMYLNSIPAITDSEKASLFNQYFHSVSTSSSYVLPPMSSFPTPNATLNNIDITEKDIFDALCSLDPSKASGPDGISQKILKFCSNYPSEWQIHSITPIHKSGDRDNISNYRPISLLSCTSKILERIIYNKIINFITNSVSNHQFGFLKHRSSIQQLLLLLNTIYNSALTHSPTDVIYLDFI